MTRMRIRLVLILLMAAAVAAAWQAEERAEKRQQLLLRSLAARLEPFGSLNYDEVHAHFWGSGSVENLRFTPAGALRSRLVLPEDFAVRIARLEFSAWPAGAPWPLRAHLRFDAMTLPLETPWPQSYQGWIDFEYIEPTRELQLAWLLEAPAAAGLQGRLALRLEEPSTLSGATLLGGTLHYRDQGLAQNARAALAARLGADPQNATAALAETLITWMTAQGLPPDDSSRAALRAFAGEPLALTLRLDPPGALRPDTLNLFAPADRLAALGWSLVNQ